jgi:DNA integrity scanning protein DisA with diadenylate cyclase activity
MKDSNIVKIWALIIILMFIAYKVGIDTVENKQQTVKKPVLSKCDSIVFANDSLVKKLEIANRRMQQYKIGLWFLRDKDKKAYDYVINAGNLNFQNEWQ